jgi:hypothetical protein
MDSAMQSLRQRIRRSEDEIKAALKHPEEMRRLLSISNRSFDFAKGSLERSIAALRLILGGVRSNEIRSRDPGAIVSIKRSSSRKREKC